MGFPTVLPSFRWWMDLFRQVLLFILLLKQSIWHRLLRIFAAWNWIMQKSTSRVCTKDELCYPIIRLHQRREKGPGIPIFLYCQHRTRYTQYPIQNQMGIYFLVPCINPSDDQFLNISYFPWGEGDFELYYTVLDLEVIIS